MLYLCSQRHMARNSSLGFRFSGRDSLPRFGVLLLLFGAGCLPIPLIVYDSFGMHSVVALLSVAILVAIGLRFSIVVSADGVLITRTWFGVPYWFHRGRAINDVFFGGDWGNAGGACGVVLEMDGREIHIGSSGSMHDLHAALLPFVSRDGEGAQTTAINASDSHC